MTGHLVREDAHRLLLERNLPVVARSMTFAKLVQPNLRFLNLKDLLWLFPPICHRKDQAALTDNEKSRFICAFNMAGAGWRSSTSPTGWCPCYLRCTLRPERST